MKRLSLQDWAALGEVVATLGVIVSLVLVAYSIDSNNKLIMATNDNLVYELQDEIYKDYATNKDLASIIIKLINGEALTAVESEQYSYQLWRHMSIWEMAFDRYKEGLLSEAKWGAWNTAFQIEITSEPLGIQREWWDAGKDTYGREFVAHVDAILGLR